jgi:hypothetical protein
MNKREQKQNKIILSTLDKTMKTKSPNEAPKGTVPSLTTGIAMR